MALELAKAANANPIDRYKANTAWRKLTGQSVQINQLEKNTDADLSHCLRYIVWKVGGVDVRKDFLHDLHEYLTKRTAELESFLSYQDVQQPKLHGEYLRALEQNVQTAEKLLAYIVKTLSNVLKGIHRHDSFGQWRGKDQTKNANAVQTYKNHACRRCGVIGNLRLVTPVRHYS